MVNSLSLPIGNKPSVILCQINETDITFENDSGSFISTLCYDDAMKLGATIETSNCKLKAYGGSQIEVIEIFHGCSAICWDKIDIHRPQCNYNVFSYLNKAIEKMNHRATFFYSCIVGSAKWITLWVRVVRW